MKKLLISIALLCGSVAFAATVPNAGFGVGTTNSGSTLSYAIISANSVNGGAPAITFLQAGSSTNTAGVQFYKIDAQTTVTRTNSTVNIPVVSTNNIGTNAQVIIIQHLQNDGYERRITDGGPTTTTNIAVTLAPMTTCVPGDIIYHCTTTGGGFIYTGVATNNIGSGAGPIYVGQPGKPLLVEITSHTTSATLNCVGGYYLK